jgi:NADH:ubiquinone oxidoreductase subunit 6 (subunit J)
MKTFRYVLLIMAVVLSVVSSLNVTTTEEEGHSESNNHKKFAGAIAGICVGGIIMVVGWSIIVIAWASNENNFKQIQYKAPNTSEQA